jgi:hypothetical protein
MTDLSCPAQRLFAPASLAVLLLPPQLASVWWNDDWAFRKRIEIDMTTGNLTATRAVAGADALGLVARKGGQDLLLGSNDSCDWHQAVLSDELNAMLMPLPADRDALLEQV